MTFSPHPTPSAWASRAIATLATEAAAVPASPVHRFPLPDGWGIDLFLVDESTQPTGSLKHRLARSLFIDALESGRLREGCTVIEASSGSTAVSEAYFARMLGLGFIAVMPSSTSASKITLIEAAGGSCRLVDDPAGLAAQAHRIAAEVDGCFLDQFSNASRVSDWAGESGIAAALFRAASGTRHPVPHSIVVGAGTGGTSTTVGRYLRARGHATSVVVADPDGSAYFDAITGHTPTSAYRGSRIEGIGRPTAEIAFDPTAVDAALTVDDALSIAGMLLLEETCGLRAGPSTGTNLVGALTVAAGMRERGETGSIVTLLCDGAERYSASYYNDAWRIERGFDVSMGLGSLRRLLADAPSTDDGTPRVVRRQIPSSGPNPGGENSRTVMIALP